MTPSSPRAAYVAVLLAFPGLLIAQSTRITGPLLGYAWDQTANRLQPILGVPGAATLGRPVDPGIAVSAAAISPVNDLMVAVSADDGQAMLMPLAAAGRHAAVGCEAWADRIVFSPRGTAAALYHSDSRIVQALRGLPGAPVPLAAAIAGPADVLAVSDDGSAVAVGTSGLVTIVGPDGASATVTITAAALVFRPGGRDLLIIDAAANQLVLVRDGKQQVLAGPEDGIAAAVAMAVSDDGGRAFVANSGGGILTVGIETGVRTITPTPQPATGFSRLRGDSVFRVTDVSAGAAWIFDGGATGPRMLFIPAVQAERSGQ